jgi:predicted GNAT family acetyltransferase
VGQVTALHTRPRVLGRADVPGLQALIQADQILNCVLDARLIAAPDLEARRLGGFLWGMNAATDGALNAAVFHGGNLIPLGHDLDALHTLADQLAQGRRGCSSIVGSAETVRVMWPVLARRWGEARAIRANQPLLVTAERPAAPLDPSVRKVTLADLPRFLPAAISMFTEELGISPIGPDGGASYRARVADVIASGRAFARFDERGRVEFKAEIGALSSGSAQVQGVWMRPDLRGRGMGTAAMASVLDFALALAPTVSLYVNDFNTVARRMYDRLGMRQVETLTTVLF